MDSACERGSAAMQEQEGNDNSFGLHDGRAFQIHRLVFWVRADQAVQIADFGLVDFVGPSAQIGDAVEGGSGSEEV